MSSAHGHSNFHEQPPGNQNIAPLFLFFPHLFKILVTEIYCKCLTYVPGT